MSKKVRYGWKGKVYVRSGGSFESPTWTECDNVGDIKIMPKYKAAVIPTREGKGLELEEPTFLGISYTGKMRDDENHAAFLLWDSAFHAKTPLDLLFLNGAITDPGARGYRMEMKLHDFSESQGNEEVDMIDWELKPCIGDNVKQRAIVSAEGAIAFSELAAA